MSDWSVIAKDGRIMIGAMDHRESLKKLLAPGLDKGQLAEQVVAVKRLMVKYLGPLCTGVLLDPEYGRDLVTEMPAGVGLLMSLEKSGYREDEIGERKTELLTGFGVREAKRLGAKAVKLLLYYHPKAKSSGLQRELVEQIKQECVREEMVFLLEPILYPLGDGSEREKRAELTVMTAETFTRTADVLKLEFPVDPKVESSQEEWRYWCKEITDRVEVPWILLSRGMEYELYKEALRVACQAGAKGFAVGRAVWQEIGQLVEEINPEQRLREIERFLLTEGRGRLAQLVEIVKNTSE